MVGVVGEYLAEFTRLLTVEDAKKYLTKCSTFVLVVGLALELLATVRTTQLSNREIASLDYEAGEARKEAGQANERAAKAEAQVETARAEIAQLTADTAVARQKQAEAELKVERLRAWARRRYIDTKPFLKALQNQPKPAGVFIVFADCDDCGYLANRLSDLLTRAGWNPSAPPLPIRPVGPNIPTDRTAIEVQGGQENGVSIVADSGQGWRPPPDVANYIPKTPYEALWIAFEKGKLAPKAGLGVPVTANFLRIVVGPKESPPVP